MFLFGLAPHLLLKWVLIIQYWSFPVVNDNSISTLHCPSLVPGHYGLPSGVAKIATLYIVVIDTYVWRMNGFNYYLNRQLIGINNINKTIS